MIANSAFLAAMVLLLLAFVLAGELEYLTPFRHLVLARLWPMLGAALIVFLNLFALFYLVGRSLFLKDTGRKLAHVDRLLQTRDTVVRDLSTRLAGED